MGRPRPKCGTYNGYARHKRLKEEACQPCKDACRQHSQSRRSRDTMTKKNCENCLRLFSLPLYAKGAGRKYCDDKCRIQAMKKHRGKRTCKYCGLQFEPRSVKGVRPNFCCEQHWKLFNEERHYKSQARQNLQMRCRSKGITVDQLLFIERMQGNRCAICGKPETAKGKAGRNNSEIRVKKLAIDHCHATKKFRGLLCGKCNAALGMLQDNLLVAENLYKYLAFHELRLKKEPSYWCGSSMIYDPEKIFSLIVEGVDPDQAAADTTIIKYH